MRLLPQLMHAGLISFKTFEAICKSLDKLAEQSNEADSEFIKNFCIASVKSKWADRAKLKKEIVAVEFIKQDPVEPAVDAVEEEILVESSVVEYQIDTTKNQMSEMIIGKKRKQAPGLGGNQPDVRK
jgi:ABC-type methionine transport system ATPase subunit